MTFIKWSLITLNEKLCPALLPSYTACVIAKSSTELQSRHRGNVVIHSASPTKGVCMLIYLFQTNDSAHLKEPAD